MGTICVPSCANIFMLEFEEKYIYPLIKKKFSILMQHKQHFSGMD